MKSNPVVHFEMPYIDPKRLSKFYKSAFGWDMQQMGKEYGGYIMAMTTESTPKGPKRPGAINGGFYKKTKDTNPFPSFVVAVDDIEKAIVVVKKAGGKVIGKPVEIPNVGMWVVVKDTEGNKLSMLQPKM